MKEKEVSYVIGMGRNPGEERGRSHVYYCDENGDYTPLCGYGWNRSDGEAISIFRGHVGAKGVCKTCQKRKEQGHKGVPPWKHKTKWL